jgi:quercetin dioxygenase-like cupin family protein
MATHSTTASSLSGPLPADDPDRRLTVVSPDDDGALLISLAGAVYTILITGEQTDGRYCLIDMRIPDGSGPPPHRHDFEEMFTILDGALDFTFRGVTTRIAAPATVNIPANAPHSFKNASGQTVHMLCMCTPAGQEEFFLAVADRLVSRSSQPPNLSETERTKRGEKAVALAAQYRTEFLV